ncbi:hypothetical protein [Agrobacterium sp. SORGH_AS 787]|uniref:hypothetical protein n=1 Tax=Agrobacterium sp. SORGH_AS 787 TaxID=3041775 RepID=UPI002789C861|nr:hypothetical protein [Rhizobium sp. SORGH_AS_0787]
MAKESEKPPVFQYLFDRRYDWGRRTFTPLTVTQEEIQDAIGQLRDEGNTLSTGNPANFMKDFLRGINRNAQWPEPIADARYTARQAYGEGRVFDFVPYQPGQTVPFPDDFALPAEPVVHAVETLSMPAVARKVGRPDDPWLMQICVQQRILHTHFAVHSELQVVDFHHLQSSLKGTPSLDALFLLTFNAGERLQKALVTFEAARTAPILPDQIKAQAAAMARRCQSTDGLGDIDFIIPVAANIATVRSSPVIAMFEMERIAVEEGREALRQDRTHELPLLITRMVGYTLNPKVAGIFGK